MKKLISLICAIALMATMCAFSVSAADGVTITVDAAAEAVVESEIVVTVKATGALGMFQMELNYDSATFTYKADSFVTTATAVALKTAEEGKLTAECQNLTGADFADDAVFTATFTALDADAFNAVIGDAAYLEKVFSVTIPYDADANGYVLGNKVGVPYTEDQITLNDATVKVTLPPTAPVVENLVIDGGDAPQVGDTLTADYDYSDINGDVEAGTTFVWKANGEVIDGATASTYVLQNADCAKTITVEVTPKNAAEEEAEGETVVSDATAVVMPVDGYVPEADFTLPEEGFIATLEYTVEVTMDDTYPEAANDTTYAWYIAESADAEVSGDPYDTDLTVSFNVADKDKYAVLIVTPVVTVGDTEFPGTPVKKATLIKGEPPVIDTTELDVEKALKAGNTVKVTEGKDFTATSKAPEGQSQELTLSYAWYLATADEYASFDPAGKEPVSETASYKMTTEDIGKYVVLYITATDALEISTTVEVKYTTAIAKKSGGATSFTENSGGNLSSKTETPTATTSPTTSPTTGTDTPAGIEKFTDVPADVYSWAVEAIDELVKAGIIVGVTDTTFEPETKTTRAHFVAMVMRAVKAVDENATSTYSDVAADYWGYKEIASAQALGALDIFGENFEPEKVIAREEMAYVLHEVAVALEIALPETATAEEFSDAASIADAAKDCVTALQKADIIHGMGDGTFMPKGETTRAQAAKVVYLLWKLA